MMFNKLYSNNNVRVHTKTMKLKISYLNYYRYIYQRTRIIIISINNTVYRVIECIKKKRNYLNILMKSPT